MDPILGIGFKKMCFRRLKRNMGRFKKKMRRMKRKIQQRETESMNEERKEGRKDPPKLPFLFAFQEGRRMRTQSRSSIICIEVAEPLYVVEAPFKAKDLFLPDDPHCGPQLLGTRWLQPLVGTPTRSGP